MELAIDDAENDKEPRKIPWKMIINTMVIFIVLIGATAAYSYISTERPDIYKNIKLKLDKFGLAPEDPMEIQRVADINKMTISYEEKQILINKTIFMGATTRMVMLALGKPKQGHRGSKTANEKDVVILVYHLPEELRPTMLHFEDNKLTKAYKGSTIDFDSTPAPYTGANSE